MLAAPDAEQVACVFIAYMFLYYIPFGTRFVNVSVAMANFFCVSPGNISKLIYQNLS